MIACDYPQLHMTPGAPQHDVDNADWICLRCHTMRQARNAASQYAFTDTEIPSLKL